jgi:uncharacterized membrane protein
MSDIPSRIRVIQAVQIALCLIGIGIAGFLWYAHVANFDVPCTSDGGCAIVAASAYSRISIGPFHNIYVAILGVMGYATLFSLGMLKLGIETKANLKLPVLGFLLVSLGGTLYSIYLQYVAFVIIGHHCVWCISSACDMTIIFVTSIIESRALQKMPVKDEPSDLLGSA